MSKPALDITHLSLDEQLDLLDRLWDSLGRDPDALPLTEGQRAELDQRLDELEAEGPTGLTWDHVAAQARNRPRCETAHLSARSRGRYQASIRLVRTGT